MINLAAMHRVRKHPAFAEYFDFVLPIFWPVVFWYLLRVADLMDARGSREALVAVHWWGGIDITYYGDPAPSPSAYRPIVPTRKPWSNPVWSSAVPAELLPEAHPLFFLRANGDFEGKAFALQTPRERMKGACALTAKADTS